MRGSEDGSSDGCRLGAESGQQDEEPPPDGRLRKLELQKPAGSESSGRGRRQRMMGIKEGKQAVQLSLKHGMHAW